MKEKRLFTRRRTLYLGLGTLAGLGTLTNARFTSGFENNFSLDDPNRDFRVRGPIPLRKRAARKGLIYGGDAGTLNLQSAPELQTAIVREWDMLVLGFLKWDLLRPTPDSFDFTRGDWYAQFAQRNRMLLRGHTLVWHEALPSWFNETVNKQNAEEFLQEHIQRVAGHYAGQLHSWDVVNEAINVKDGLPNGLRKSPWLDFLGPDYIDQAFRLAAQVDPQAMLVYNDFGLEYDTPEDEAKRNAVLKLLERLKSQGTPVHAFGMQSHLFADETRFNPDKLRNFFRDIASLGLKIMITELDVIDRKLPRDIAVRDRIVASVYEDYLSVALEERAVIAVLNWGLSDRHTWLSEFFPRADKAPVRPLPLDDQMQRKLAWNGMARAFDSSRRR
jgi:endo-1,4-beta-xylanase